MSLDSSLPQISVVVPVFNEQGNIEPLVCEVVSALRGLVAFEIIYVDDCSKDDSRAVLKQLQQTTPELRVFGHTSQSGQSTAIRNGVKLARGAVKLFAGWRVERKDTGSKRWASKIANAIRSRLLRDETPDTGCGIKLFERAVFLELPYFDHMHRYLPALVKRAGYQSVSVPVNHRERGTGVSKYNNLGRAWVGISDFRGVGWLIKRSKITGTVEL
jgi:dolichol-phosphate mannosyltransferase